MRHIKIFFTTLFITSLMTAQAAFAASITASTSESLLSALRDSQNSATPLTITLATNGTYVFTTRYDEDDNDGYTALPSIHSHVTIEGNGSTLLMDPADSTFASNFRLFYILSSGSLTLQNIILGASDAYEGPIGSGGAIYNTGTLNITNAAFANIYADGGFGGVIYASGTETTTTIANATFANNGAGHGGAISNEDGAQLSINASVFSENIAHNSSVNGSGGAIDNDDASLTVSEAIFLDNTAGQGGAIYCDGEAGTLSINTTTFARNEATSGHGGAIYLSTAHLHVEKSAFSLNQADNGGGALYVFHSGDDEDTWTIEESTFYRNTATSSSSRGGAIRTLQSTAGSLRNVTIIENTADQGGGISHAITSDPLTFSNVVIANNTANTDTNVSENASYIITNGNAFGAYSMKTDLVDISNGSIIALEDEANIVDTLLSTLTNDESRPAHTYLSPTCTDDNPLIDAGECADNYTDQIGNNAAAICDLGAVEAICDNEATSDNQEQSSDNSVSPSSSTAGAAGGCALIPTK